MDLSFANALLELRYSLSEPPDQSSPATATEKEDTFQLTSVAVEVMTIGTLVFDG